MTAFERWHERVCPRTEEGQLCDGKGRWRATTWQGMVHPCWNRTCPEAWLESIRPYETSVITVGQEPGRVA